MVRPFVLVEDVEIEGERRVELLGEPVSRPLGARAERSRACLGAGTDDDGHSSNLRYGSSPCRPPSRPKPDSL